MDYSSAERVDSSSQTGVQATFHLFCSSVTLLAIKFVLIFIRVLCARHLKIILCSCFKQNIKSLLRHLMLIGEIPKHSSNGG